MLENYIENMNFHYQDKAIQLQLKFNKLLESEESTFFKSNVKDYISILLEDYVRSATIAKFDDQFAFEIIQKPYIPEIHSFPTKRIFAIYGIILGFLLFIFYLIFIFRNK